MLGGSCLGKPLLRYQLASVQSSTVQSEQTKPTVVPEAGGETQCTNLSSDLRRAVECPIRVMFHSGRFPEFLPHVRGEAHACGILDDSPKQRRVHIAVMELGSRNELPPQSVGPFVVTVFLIDHRRLVDSQRRNRLVPPVVAVSSNSMNSAPESIWRASWIVTPS